MTIAIAFTHSGLVLLDDTWEAAANAYTALQETRESLGVRLEGNIVVVDEAHNLVDAVNNVHSALVSAQQLATAQSALDNYFQRFRSVLAPGVCLHPWFHLFAC